MLTDPLAPLDTFRVGDWNVSIHQEVSGTLFWRAVPYREGDMALTRTGRYGVGFSVADVRRFLEADLLRHPGGQGVEADREEGA